MVVCPECAGPLKWSRNLKQYVCQRCGLSLTREELDEARERLRGEIYTRPGEEKSRRHKEYLNWWLGDKKKKK